MTVLLALILAFIWGGIWAGFLQFTLWGQFLARKRTWFTVVTGIGVDLIIAWLVVPAEYWCVFTGIIVCSGILIVVRSLVNEWDEWKELLKINVHENEAGE